jgi:hypothetical protein
MDQLCHLARPQACTATTTQDPVLSIVDVNRAKHDLVSDEATPKRVMPGYDLRRASQS